MIGHSRFRILFWSILVFVLLCGIDLHNALAASSSGTSLTTSPVTLGLDIKPGTTSIQKLQVMNNTSKPMLIAMQVETFGAYGNSGEAAISGFPSGDPAAKWIHISPSSFVAQPGVWMPVQATISLPKTASLGYYYAVVFQPVIPAQLQVPGAKIVKGFNAILVLVDTGSVGEQRQVKVANFTVNKHLFEYLPASFSVTIQNPGNIYLAPTGDIFISRNSNGTNTIDTIPVNGGVGNVLPNSYRVFTTLWADGFPEFVPKLLNGQPETSKNGQPVEQLKWDFSKANKFRFGKYYARLALVYKNGSHEVLLNSTLSFWVIPWKLLAVIFIIILLFGFALWSIGHGVYRRIRSLKKFHKT